MLPLQMRDWLIKLLNNPGNCIEEWEDEGDAGFTFITDDDVHLAISIGVVERSEW